MRARISVAAAAVAAASLSVVVAPAAHAATDVAAPVIGRAKVTPATVVLTSNATTKVTVDVVVTDDVAVTEVGAVLYRGATPETAIAALGLDSFVRLPGTSTWRAVAYFPKSAPAGAYKLLVGAWDGHNEAERDAVAVAVLKRDVRMPLFGAGPEPVRKGALLRVSGQLTRLNPARGYVPYAGRVVGVYFRPVGGSWVLKGTVTTDTTGKWSRSFTATVDGAWRARFAGNSSYMPRVSAADYVDVR